MTTLNNEQLDKNYSIFIQKLANAGVDLSNIDEDIANKIKYAPFTANADSGTAYEGALIDVTLKTLTVFAVKLNEILPDNVKVNVNQIVKVCLLHQLSKAEMFIKNTNEWEISKRGLIYTYAPSKIALKMGMKSLILAQKLGVTFTDEEIEAMTILDRDACDEQAKFFANPLSIIVKQAAELTYLKFRNQ